MVTILRDAGLSGLIESESVEQLAGGFQFTEGPLWQPDGSLLFQDIKAERSYRLERDRSVRLLRDHTGAANGQTFGAGGSIVFCEQTGRRISRLGAPDGPVEPIAETWAGATAQQSQRHRVPVRRPDLFHRPGLWRRAVAASAPLSGRFCP